MKDVKYIVKFNGLINIKQFDYDEQTTIGLTSEMLLSVDEIVYDIITNRLSDYDESYFRKCSKSDLYSHHLDFGMWIRNTYGLWEVLINPLVEQDSEPDSIKHPDNRSFEIMELVTKTLRNEYLPNVSFTEKDFDNAMEIVGET